MIKDSKKQDGYDDDSEERLTKRQQQGFVVLTAHEFVIANYISTYIARNTREKEGRSVAWSLGL